MMWRAKRGGSDRGLGGDPPSAWILAHVLYVPRTEATTIPEGGQPWASASGFIGLPVTDDGGVRSLCVFTSEAEFGRSRPADPRCIGLEAVALMKAFLDTPADRIVVNGASPDAFAIDRREAKLLIKIVARTPGDSPRMLLSPPPAEAAALASVLRASCARHRELREAYLFRAYIAETGAPPPDGVPDDAWQLELLLGFDTALADARGQEISDAILNAVHAAAANQPNGRFPPFRVRKTSENYWLRTVSRSGAPIAVPADSIAGLELSNARALVGRPPRKPPEEFLQAIRNVCSSDDTVTAAYYFQMALLDRHDGPQLFIGLRLRTDATIEQQEAALRAVGSITGSPAGTGYDVINLTIEPPDGSQDHGETFYERT